MAFNGAAIKFTLSANQTPAVPVSGQLSALTAFELALASGTTANKADLASKTVHTVPDADNIDIDLRALADVLGATMSTLTEVVALVIESTHAVTVKPSASNGWLGLLADASDVLNVAANAKVIVICAADGAYSVGASTKSINVANAGGTDATLTLTLIGRSA